MKRIEFRRGIAVFLVACLLTESIPLTAFSTSLPQDFTTRPIPSIFQTEALGSVDAFARRPIDYTDGVASARSAASHEARWEIENPGHQPIVLEREVDLGDHAKDVNHFHVTVGLTPKANPRADQKIFLSTVELLIKSTPIEATWEPIEGTRYRLSVPLPLDQTLAQGIWHLEMRVFKRGHAPSDGIPTDLQDEARALRQLWLSRKESQAGDVEIMVSKFLKAGLKLYVGTRTIDPSHYPFISRVFRGLLYQDVPKPVLTNPTAPDEQAGTIVQRLAESSSYSEFLQILQTVPSSDRSKIPSYGNTLKSGDRIESVALRSAGKIYIVAKTKWLDAVLPIPDQDAAPVWRERLGLEKNIVEVHLEKLYGTAEPVKGQSNEFTIVKGAAWRVRLITAEEKLRETRTAETHLTRTQATAMAEELQRTAVPVESTHEKRNSDVHTFAVQADGRKLLGVLDASEHGNSSAEVTESWLSFEDIKPFFDREPKDNQWIYGVNVATGYRFRAFRVSDVKGTGEVKTDGDLKAGGFELRIPRADRNQWLEFHIVDEPNYQDIYSSIFRRVIHSTWHRLVVKADDALEDGPLQYQTYFDAFIRQRLIEALDHPSTLIPAARRINPTGSPTIAAYAITVAGRHYVLRINPSEEADAVGELPLLDATHPLANEPNVSVYNAFTGAAVKDHVSPQAPFTTDFSLNAGGPVQLYEIRTPATIDDPLKSLGEVIEQNLPGESELQTYSSRRALIDYFNTHPSLATRVAESDETAIFAIHPPSGESGFFLIIPKSENPAPETPVEFKPSHDTWLKVLRKDHSVNFLLEGMPDQVKPDVYYDVHDFTSSDLSLQNHGQIQILRPDSIQEDLVLTAVHNALTRGDNVSFETVQSLIPRLQATSGVQWLTKPDLSNLPSRTNRFSKAGIDLFLMDDISAVGQPSAKTRPLLIIVNRQQFGTKLYTGIYDPEILQRCLTEADRLLFRNPENYVYVQEPYKLVKQNGSEHPASYKRFRIAHLNTSPLLVGTPGMQGAYLLIATEEEYRDTYTSLLTKLEQTQLGEEARIATQNTWKEFDLAYYQNADRKGLSEYMSAHAAALGVRQLGQFPDANPNLTGHGFVLKGQPYFLTLHVGESGGNQTGTFDISGLLDQFPRDREYQVANAMTGEVYRRVFTLAELQFQGMPLELSEQEPIQLLTLVPKERPTERTTTETSSVVSRPLPGLGMFWGVLNAGSAINRKTGQLENRDSLKNVQALIPFLKKFGFTTLYLFGLWQPFVGGRSLHHAPTVGSSKRYVWDGPDEHTQTAFIRVPNYETGGVDVDGKALNDGRNGNIFSMDGKMLNISLANGLPKDREKAIRKTVKLANAHGIEFVADIIPRLAPGSITADNFENWTYWKDPPAEWTARYNSYSYSPEEEKKVHQENLLMELLDQPDNKQFCAIRIFANGQERVILVALDNDGKNLDQVRLKIENPSVQNGLREWQIYLQGLGIHHVRWDMPHIVTRHEQDNPPNPQAEPIRHALVDGVKHIFETAEPGPRSHLAKAVGPDVRFYDNRLQQAYWKIDREHASAETLDDIVKGLLADPLKLLIFVSNFDETSLNAMTGSDVRQGMAMVMLALALASLNPDHIQFYLSHSDLFYWWGVNDRVAGGGSGRNDQESNKHLLSRTLEEVLLQANPPEQRKRLREVHSKPEQPSLVPIAEALRDFAHAVPKDGYIPKKDGRGLSTLDESNRNGNPYRYFTLSWEREPEVWTLLTADIRGGDNETTWVRIPSDAFTKGLTLNDYVAKDALTSEDLPLLEASDGKPARIDLDFDRRSVPYRLVTLQRKPLPASGKERIEQLAKTVTEGQTGWQSDPNARIVMGLPLVVTSFDTTAKDPSPYMGLSSFANDELNYVDASKVPDLPAGALESEQALLALRTMRQRADVNYEISRDRNRRLLGLAFENFYKKDYQNKTSRYEEFNAFLNLLKEKDLYAEVENTALFRALLDRHQGKSWQTWEPVYQNPDSPEFKESIERDEKIQDRVVYYLYTQFLFWEQMTQVRIAGHKNNVHYIADVPMYSGPNSAEVWRYKDRIYDRGHSAGADKDAFSPEMGQYWGLPTYQWLNNEPGVTELWRKKIRFNALFCDGVRLDHLNGFFGEWNVPISESNLPPWQFPASVPNPAATGNYVPQEPGQMTELGTRVLRTLSQEAHASGLELLIGEDLGDLPGKYPAIRAAIDALAEELPMLLYYMVGWRSGEDFKKPVMAVFTGSHDSDPDFEGRLKNKEDIDVDAFARLAGLFEIAGYPIAAQMAKDFTLDSNRRALQEPSGLTLEQQEHAQEFIAHWQRERGLNSLDEVVHDVVRTTLSIVMHSPNLKILPIQELMKWSGVENRVNRPGTGTESRNWTWLMPVAVEELGPVLLETGIPYGPFGVLAPLFSLRRQGGGLIGDLTSLGALMDWVGRIPVGHGPNGNHSHALQLTEAA